MFRKGLAEDEGMLFIFDKEERHNFWMKNMEFALDIIWVGRDRRIVDIHQNVPPCRDECPGISPRAQAGFVLEVNAGFVRKNHIRIGDSLTLTGI